MSCRAERELISLRDNGRPHAVQTTMRRFGRKSDDEPTGTELPLTIFCSATASIRRVASATERWTARRAGQAADAIRIRFNDLHATPEGAAVPAMPLASAWWAV